MGNYPEARKVFKVEDFSLTIASETKRKFSEMYPIKKFWMPSKLDSYFRQAYSGGRVEVFKRYGKNLKQYDFKSMYSYVMDKYDYPTGLAVYTAKFKTGYLGIYTVKVKTPKDIHIPFLHAYDETGKLLFPIGEWQGTYTSIEIEKAISLGYKIDVLCGYYFTQRMQPFKEYIKHFYSMKQEAEKKGQKSLRYIAKLHLNSLYGKFGQRRNFGKVLPIKGSLRDMMNKHIITDVLTDLNMVVVDEESRSPYTSVHVACFVTAYSRLELYQKFEEVQNKGGDLYYTDTDCLVTNVELKTGKNLGDLDVEGEVKEGWFLFPKFYGYIQPDGTEKVRAKGLSRLYKAKDYRFAYKKNNYSRFKDKSDSIIGILEGNRRHIGYLDVIERERICKGIFTKRTLCTDKNNTKPINLIRK